MLPLYLENLVLTVGVFILLAWACYLPLLGGQLFNGAIYCAALAAYFAGYTSMELGWPIWLSMVGGVCFSGLVSWGMSFFLASLTMFQMAVVTMALIFIFQTVFRNLEFLGGVIGMSGLPRVDNLVIICLVVILICMILIHRLSTSRWGRALEAVEFDRDMAQAMGVNIKMMSISLQTAAGVLGGLAGVIYAFNLGTVHPEVFGFGQLLYCFTIVFVGGRFTPWGPFIMAPILWLIPEFFPEAIAELRNIFFGLIIIASLLLRPKGLITKSLISNLRTKAAGSAGPA